MFFFAFNLLSSKLSTMLKRISGNSNILPFPKTASTVMTAGAAVKLTSGQIVLGAQADTVSLGIVQQTIATTDGDYAKTTPVLVDMFDTQQVIEADVTNGGAVPGTLASTMVGQYFKLDAAATPASASIDSNTATNTPITSGAIYVCVGFISASKGLFKLLTSAAV